MYLYSMYIFYIAFLFAFLEKADHKAIFGPVIGNALKTVLPNRNVEQKTIDLINGSVSQVDKNNNNIKQLNISNWSKTDKDMKKDAMEIVSLRSGAELKKQKDIIAKNNTQLRK